MIKLNNTLKLPINLALGVGAYTTRLYIGSEQIPVDVLIDTGSSTLAIDLKKYQPEKDQHMNTTVYAQDVVYGNGGWAGPVLNTHIQLDHEDKHALEQAPLSVTCDEQQQNFQGADGIWGLAYHHLNKAYDVSSYLDQQTPALPATYPWPFTVSDDKGGISGFKSYLQQFPEHDITPLFTAFEANGIVANQFALLTHRSIEYVPEANLSQQDIAGLPENQGTFFIGFSGDHDIPSAGSTRVLHDAYYNTNLISIRVDGFKECPAPPLDDKHLHSFFSNAIIDSGSSFVMLQKKLYDYLHTCLQTINASFSELIKQSLTALQSGEGIFTNELQLDQWPDVIFTFEGLNGQITELRLSPQTYWQQHAKQANRWLFMIMTQMPQWPDQTICGLPLMNNYLCVFDRSELSTGVIHWLIKPVAEKT
ncbi:hypothetical protein ACFODZ_16510 [Marinicella sediminis]|uniref:Peptidase A1 domain-containing protein n=1 Tax=Marinicella sediminis TaxID=1792834 RepID=A0ABV7JCL4_9GAMM|nr:hypothetical protein [Marinicella sediminis]